MAVRSLRNPPPLSISHYELTGQMASGKMAALYRGRDTETDALVAVQLIPSDTQPDLSLFDRLRAEFALAYQLEHPNLLRLYDFGRESGYWYIVAEWLDGTTLSRTIRGQSRLPEDTAIRIITQVGQAVDFAAQGGLVVRARPSNIVVRGDGVAKLIPFGPAAGCVPPPPMSGVKSGSSPLDGPLPDPGNAPVADPVYCLAITLHAAVTGQRWAPAPAEINRPRERGSHRTPTPPRITGLSSRVEGAVNCATAADPAARPQTCAEFLRMLHGRYRTAGSVRSDLRIPATGKDDHRAEVRYAVGLGSSGRIHNSVFDTSGDGSASQEVWPLVIRDVSMTGIGILLARRCELGTELLIVLNAQPGRPPRAVTARVVRVKRESHGHWSHGCAFPEPISAADLASLFEQIPRDAT